MKLTMTRVLTPLAALAFAFSAQADLPANEGFEGAQLDASWTFVPGTDSAPDASAITAYGDDAKPADSLVGTDLPGLPDGFTSDGDNYLKLSTEDGTLFRKVNGDAGMSAGAGLYLDTVVQFTVTDQGDRPVPSTTSGEEDKFIIWLEAGASTTNLCVYGGEYGLSETTIGLTRSKVYTLSADDVEIEPGTWHRLTVKAVSNMGLDATGSQYTVGEIPAFQVYVDGVLLKPVESMLADSGLSQEFVNWSAIGTAGFVPAMVPGGMLSKVGFSGEGKLDDVVITTQMPGVEPHDTVTFTWESEKVASITPYANGTELGTFTASPATINVPVGATITLAAEEMGAAQGYNSSYFAFGESEVADVAEGGKSLSYEFDSEAGLSATIALDIEYTLAYDVTVDWSSLLLDDVVGITIGDVTISDDGLFESSYEVKGLAPGASFSVTVAYVPGSPLQTIYDLTSDPDGGLTINGSTITIPVDYMESGDVSLTVSLSAEAPATKLFAIGDTQYTLDELAEALAGDGITTSQAQPLTLLDDVELEEGLTIVADSEQWLDLAGNTLTGPAEGTLFTVAGTLNIVDSGVGGAVEAGTIASVAATGVLNLTAGDYTGEFDLDEDGVIYITGGTFDADVEGATFPVGYGLVYDAGDEVFEYAIKTYTITYNLNEGSGTTPADTTFTVESAGTIAGGDDLTAPAGKTFGGWNTAADGSGTDYAAGAATPEVTAELEDFTLYAKWVEESKGVEPGQQDATEYDSAEAAQAAAGDITIAVPEAVAAAVPGLDQEAYKALFAAKPVAKNDKFVLEVGFADAAVTGTLQPQANADAAAVLDATATTIATTPGLYYSLKQGTTLDGMTEGTRVLATGDTVSLSDLGLDKTGTAGFYKVLINFAPKAE